MIKYQAHIIALIIKMIEKPKGCMEIVGDYRKFHKIKIIMINFIVKDVKVN